MVASLKQVCRQAWKEGGWAGVLTRGLWVYWAFFALVTPVTFFDSHTYNLARLELFRIGGFWGNSIWNTERQISFPWTFDAVHLPFLRLGIGVALPSFACFTGLLWIVHRLVRNYRSPRAAWLCCLGIVAMPMMVYQATSTKNDIVIVFAMACWLYALIEFRRTGRFIHLVAMAVALGLSAGSKSIGIPFALLGGLVSLGQIGANFRAHRLFASCCLISIVCLGSIETYINNYRIFGHPIGSTAFVDSHRNLEGTRGAAANFTRYVFGNITTGIEPLKLGDYIAAAIEKLCRSNLTALGLGDAGIRHGYNDRNTRFPHDAAESTSDFGLIGTLGIFSIIGAFMFYRRFDRAVLLLALTAVVSLGIISYTTAWMPWNNRFLMGPMVAAALVLMLFVEQSDSRWLRVFILVVATFGALHPLLFSFNRKPEHIKKALFNRQLFSLRENAGFNEVLTDIQARVAAGYCRRLVLSAGPDSWILPFFSIHGLEVQPMPELTVGGLAGLDRETTCILVLDHPLNSEIANQIAIAKAYKMPKATLYRISRSD